MNRISKLIFINWFSRSLQNGLGIAYVGKKQKEQLTKKI